MLAAGGNYAARMRTGDQHTMTEEQARALLDSRVWGHEGTTLRPSPLGLGLFTTRAFRAGEVIYRAGILTLADTDQTFTARLLVDGQPQPIALTPEHMVRFDGTRWLDAPGCFINHACEPTTASVFFVDEVTDWPIGYDQIALVDLAPGDELTCDYTRFDWGDDGLAFSCTCGSAECYGWIDGFGGLPRSVQERTAGSAIMESARRWALLSATS